MHSYHNLQIQACTLTFSTLFYRSVFEHVSRPGLIVDRTIASVMSLQSSSVTVRFFDNGSREVVSRDDIATVEGSVPDSGDSELVLAIGCFVRIRGRDAVVIPNVASPSGSGLSAHAAAIPSVISPALGSSTQRKRPRGLNIG